MSIFPHHKLLVFLEVLLFYTFIITESSSLISLDLALIVILVYVYLAEIFSCFSFSVIIPYLMHFIPLFFYQFIWDLIFVFPVNNLTEIFFKEISQSSKFHCNVWPIYTYCTMISFKSIILLIISICLILYNLFWPFYSHFNIKFFLWICHIFSLFNDHLYIP